MKPTIWVDADARPNLIKTVLFRARKGNELRLVANHMAVPPSKYIAAIRVGGGFDVADDYIVQQRRQATVITADIPLAAEIIRLQFCAESAWRSLQSRQYRREVGDAQFHGGHAIVACCRRSRGDERQGCAEFCQCPDRFLAHRAL